MATIGGFSGVEQTEANSSQIDNWKKTKLIIPENLLHITFVTFHPVKTCTFSQLPVLMNGPVTKNNGGND